MNKPQERIDLGLAIMSIVNTGGHAFSLKDMADVCEVHPNAIHELERKAKRKFYMIFSERYGRLEVLDELGAFAGTRRK